VRGEHGDADDRQGAARRLRGASIIARPPRVCTVAIETPSPGRAHRARHRVGDIVPLEVEEDPASPVGQRPQQW
jgi:hypothetical protein